MFKVMILLRRKPSLSQEEFAHWWLNTHRPLALSLPRLRRMVINLSETGTGVIDGISELWFDSEADYEAAYASETGRAVTADSLSMAASRERVIVCEHSFELSEAGSSP